MTEWETINITHPRKNGLKAVGAREGRSAIKQLDWILREYGVQELNDSELQRELKLIKKKDQEEIPAAIRNK